MEDDLLGSSKPPFLRTSRAPLGIGWNTSSLWLTRLEENSSPCACLFTRSPLCLVTSEGR